MIAVIAAAMRAPLVAVVRQALDISKLPRFA
jgi:hypothetical protein